MAMRSVPLSRGAPLRILMERNLGSTTSGIRYFSDKGSVLSEEERAAENVYIKKMERERLEKKKLKEEKAKAEKEKSDKKAGETHNS